MSDWAFNPTSHGTGRIRKIVLKSFSEDGISSDRAGTRTQDQRINLPHRLSPTTLGFRGVERLDYTIAIAGVPRLVSGAGADGPPVPCLLITQSPTFSDRHACRYRRRCGAWGSPGRPSKLRHSLVAVRFLPASRLLFDSTFELKSVALPTELPGQGRISISQDGRAVQTLRRDLGPASTIRPGLIPRARPDRMVAERR
jgi:hypothetical protein